MKAPFAASAPVTFTLSVLPYTICEPLSSSPRARFTSSRWSLPASAPMRTPSVRGSPITGHQDAARAGAALAALQRHLLAHFLDEEVELLGAGGGVGAEHDGIEAVGLHVEGHALVHDARVALEHAAGTGAAGEGDHVLAHHGFGEVAGGRGRLADAGHARQEAGRELLQQAPDGEVECVDVHGHAAPGYQDVSTRKHARLAQWQGRSFVHDVA